MESLQRVNLDLTCAHMPGCFTVSCTSDTASSLLRKKKSSREDCTHKGRAAKAACWATQGHDRLQGCRPISSARSPLLAAPDMLPKAVRGCYDEVVL